MNIGERIGDYEIVQILGAGGMGKVYQVRNVLSDRIEAMKVLHPNLEDDAGLADRFLREIKLQAALDHPNIARLHTAQIFGNQVIMVMEYVEGSTIEQLMANGPLGFRDTIAYISQVLEALTYAHERGVVHRDIKPANIMRTTQGTVKLMDFGIARMATDRKLTQTGHTVGSLFYMSPEQIKGSQPDPRSDLYSLGITLYEMLTGRRPFEGTSDFSIMAAHLQQVPIAPIEVIPGIPAVLSDIILMAIAKEPEARFQSAQAMRAALNGIAPPSVDRTLVTPRPSAAPTMISTPPPAFPQPVYATPPRTSRRGLYMTLGSIATIGVIALAIVMVPRFRKTDAVSLPEPAQPPVATQPGPPPAAIDNTPTPTPAAGSRPSLPPQQQPSLPPQQSPPTQIAPSQNPPAQASPVNAAPAPQPPQNPVTPPPQQVTPPPQQPVRQSPPPPSPELGQLREDYNLVSVRASAAKSGLRSLEQQMRRQGLDLRGDIVEAESRMDYLLMEAMDSIRSGDVASARRNLQMAERALETIEKFQGR